MKGRNNLAIPDRIRAAVAPPTTPAFVVIERVSAAFGITPAELRGTSKRQHYADARAVAAWLLNQRGLSYGIIARLLNRAPHHPYALVRRMQRALRGNPELRALVLALEEKKPKLDLEPTCQHGHIEDRCETYVAEAAE